MNLLTLLLPLVVQTQPVVTVQLKTYEVRSDLNFTSSAVIKSSSERGQAVVFFDPQSPSEAELLAKAKTGEVKTLSAPTIRTLSGQEGQVEMRQDVGEGTSAASTIQTLKVKPAVSKNGTITLDVFATSMTTAGEKTTENLNASARFAIREGKTVFLLAPMKQDRKRSLLILVRASAS